MMFGWYRRLRERRADRQHAIEMLTSRKLTWPGVYCAAQRAVEYCGAGDAVTLGRMLEDELYEGGKLHVDRERDLGARAFELLGNQQAADEWRGLR